MPPTGSEIGNRNANISALYIWAEQNGNGIDICFDFSTGF